MASAPPSSPLQLVGRFTELDDNGVRGELTSARRIELVPGRVTFVAESRRSDEGWSLRIASTDGRTFRGMLSRPGVGTQHSVVMTLWQSPSEEAQWLLLGTWTDDDGTELPWSIELGPARQ